MAFDTAILYDVENLLRGYAASPGLIEGLSLTDILDTIRRSPGVGQIALQKAYANWSDPRLSVMRGEINALGIDPVQVFGFARDQKKNAADIQLAVDAVDLSHIRPTLTTFVIVSGDGGFTALAKKLHEYGKTVIGCGYKSSASKVFRAVCDLFIEIPDPEEQDDLKSQQAAAASGGENPILTSLRSHLKPVKCTDAAQTLAQGRKVLEWLATRSELKNELRTQGTVPSLVRTLLDYAIVDFRPIQLGYGKFKEALQCLCANSPLKLVFAPPNDLRVLSREKSLPGFEDLPDLSPRDLNTEEGLRAVLLAATPSIRLPEPEALRQTAAFLCAWRPSEVAFSTMLEALSQQLGSDFSVDSLKRCLFCFLSAGAFKRYPEGVPIAEANFTLGSAFETPNALLGAVAGMCRASVLAAGLSVDETLLERLIPSA